MGRKLARTPRSRVTAALRQLWLRSRERAAAIKRESGCCEVCGDKQSKAKGKEVILEVHHRNGIQWKEIVDLIYEQLLCHPDKLEVLCSRCHHCLHERDEESGDELKGFNSDEKEGAKVRVLTTPPEPGIAAAQSFQDRARRAASGNHLSVDPLGHDASPKGSGNNE